ncbi:MAG: sigma-70 family RNA polymerase sigma factor, partial [Nocardioidaceae bacterium]|nr:sigma-70 family RNA polymerase sigma factor [Nocardioidaceae bacterium]
MSLMQPLSPEIGQAPDEAWANDLTDTGPPGFAAQQNLHALLLRATRHQIWRLRHQLPGAGQIDLDDLAHQAADDALLAVLSKLDTFQGRSRFTTWVYKFGILHAGVAVRRQAWRHREVSLIDGFEPPETGSAPEHYALGNDLQRAVQTAISTQLTDHPRRVTVALVV